MGQVSRKLKKYILGIALGIALMCGKESYAQYNREYFFWVGRSCMMNNDYQEAIRTLNTLLRVDEEAYEGYFLRGIAKFNLNDLIGAEADFTIAIDKNPVYTLAYTYRAITRLRLARAPATTLVAAKLLPYFLINQLQFVVMLLLGRYLLPLLGVPPLLLNGPLWPYALLAVAVAYKSGLLRPDDPIPARRG